MIYSALSFLLGCFITWIYMAHIHHQAMMIREREHAEEMKREFATEIRLANLMRIQDDMLDKYESECI